MAMEVGAFVLPVLATILTVLGTAFAKKMLDKMGIERSEKIDDMIDKYVALGVESAQRFGEKKLDGGRDMAGRDKLTMAISTVLRELDQSGVKGVGEELIRHRIESYLGIKSANTAGN